MGRQELAISCRSESTGLDIREPVWARWDTECLGPEARVTQASQGSPLASDSEKPALGRRCCFSVRAVARPHTSAVTTRSALPSTCRWNFQGPGLRGECPMWPTARPTPGPALAPTACPWKMEPDVSWWSLRPLHLPSHLPSPATHTSVCASKAVTDVPCFPLQAPFLRSYWSWESRHMPGLQPLTPSPRYESSPQRGPLNPLDLPGCLAQPSASSPMEPASPPRTAWAAA